MGIRTRVGTLTRTRTRTRLGSYFDSKVLSRQHAEIWEETGKIFIKDVKSSNGTFINSERLSLEGMESDPWELKSDDIVEFGIDIVGDDNKILHYKVASRVFCLFNEQDLQIAHRSEQHQHQQRHQQVLQPHPHCRPGHPLRPSTTPHSSSALATAAVHHGAPRRASEEPRDRDGATEPQWDHEQGPRYAWRITTFETTSIPTYITPVRPLQTLDAPEPEPEARPAIPPTALSDLQAQLHKTQASVASHIDKTRALEDLLNEQESL
ncbi:hypothetical protein EYR36_005543 [Pleurotus pulmonarius]|nr:hypothetical protein EYR36_005543 [Pleurotus pulmonarius]